MILVPLEAIELCKRWEGLHRKVKGTNLVQPYLCPAGYWTIGYGHLCSKDTAPITEHQAELFLAEDLKVALAGTLRQCPNLAAEPSARLAAIVDFVFNLGAGRLQTSTLKKRVLDRDWDAAAKELRRWVYGGGKVLPGLVARREDEIRLLLSPRPLQVETAVQSHEEYPSRGQELRYPPHRPAQTQYQA